MSFRARFCRAAASALLAAGALLLPGCARASEKREAVTDREGRAVILPEKISTVISTAPSNSEIIIGLGQGGKIIASDEFSAKVEGMPPGVTVIDFSYPDGETIIALDPDLIIAADHNRIVSGDDPFKLISEAGIAVVYVPTSGSIDGIYQDIGFIAGLLGAQEEGRALAASLRAEIEAVAEKGRAVAERKSVYLEISPPPFMVTTGRGSYLHEMIGVIGADNIFADIDGWFSPSEEAVIERNPDVIIAFPQNSGNFGGIGNIGSMDSFTAGFKERPGFEHIGAVRNSRIFPIDANSASRPSQNIVTALKQLARAVYPEIYEAP